MMKLVARIRDFLTEFLSKYLSVKPIWQEISSYCINRQIFKSRVRDRLDFARNYAYT